MQGLKTVKQLYTIITICFITIGFVLLIWPQIGLNLICKIVGVFLITHGVLRLAGYFPEIYSSWHFSLIWDLEFSHPFLDF